MRALPGVIPMLWRGFTQADEVLLLAAAGLYGLFASSVTQRTRRISVRPQSGEQLGIGLFIGFRLTLPWSKGLPDMGLYTRAYYPAGFVPVLLGIARTAVVATVLPRVRCPSARLSPGDRSNE